MALPVIQPSFGAGEISPALYGRVDLAKFHSGAALMRNFFADYRGGASNRPGTMYVGRCLPGINRLIPFAFSTIQTYALVFSDTKMRVVMNGGLVLEAPFNIATVTKQSPVFVGIAPITHWSVGDWIYITGIVPTTGTTYPLNGGFYQIYSITDTFGIELLDLDGNVVDGTNFPGYLNGGTVARVYTLTTPYAAADLALVKFVQSADTMTLCHPNYPPQMLTRSAHANWAMVPVSFVPTSAAPSVNSATASNTSGTTTYNYVVTAIGANGVTESLPSAVVSATGAAMSKTSGASVTVAWTALAGAQLYSVYRQAEVIDGNAQSGQLFGFVGDCTGTSFTDQNIVPDFTQTPPQNNNPFAGANNSPGCTTYYQSRQVFSGSNNAPDTLFLSKSSDFYNMGYSSPSRPNDSIVAPIVARQVNPIKHLVPMDALIALSASGAWKIDASSSGGPITPSAIEAVPQAYNGCSDVPPITVNMDILYVQNKGSIVRDLAYNFYAKIYTGSDLTVLSSHLVFGHQILEWAWAEEPFKIVWCVRDDGVLLSFTYLKEQEIYSWAWHDTQGQFKSICTISEGTEDAVYVIVNREVNGVYKQFIERMASRKIGSVPERGVPADFIAFWFVDCGLQYPLNKPAATLTPSAIAGTLAPVGATIVSGGSGYSAQTTIVISDATGTGTVLVPTIIGGVITAVTKTANVVTAYTNPTLTVHDSNGTGSGAILAPIMSRDVTFTADSTVFGSTSAGDLFTGGGGYGKVRVVNSNAQITVDLWQPLATILPIAPNWWSCTKPVSVVSGLQHIAGLTVSVLADGNVQTSKVVAADGTVTLDQPASAIVIGLPYKSQLRSLYSNIPGEPTDQGRRKSIPAATVRVQDTRGLKVGNNTDPVLKEMKERSTELMGAPIAAFTGDRRVVIGGSYDVPGQVLIEQDYPLPATVLSIIPEVTVGDTPST